MSLISPRLRAQIVKELLSVLRDPRARFILIGPPLVQLLIFSFAATLEVKNTSIAIYDRDGGQWAQELQAAIGAAGFVGHVRRAGDRAQLQEWIEQRQVLLAIDIPATFSREISAGRRADLQVLVDGRRANSGQVAYSYIEAIAANLGARAQRVSPQAADLVTVRHLFNPNLIYRFFIVPSLAGTLAMFSALMVTALSIARERELGTFDQLLVSPTTPMEIVIAKTLPALLIGTTLGMMMVAAGSILFVRFTGSVLLLVAMMMLFILANVGVGLMISAVCATQQQAILGAFACAVPMILMSGFATPVENMPQVLQWVASAIPLRHFLIVVQGAFLKASPLDAALAAAWPMALTAVFTLGAATLLVRSRLQ